MVKILLFVACLSLSFTLCGQGFEVAVAQDNVKGIIGETVKTPVRFKNNTEKTITIVIKKISAQIGSTQKNFFCIDNNCLDAKVEDYIVRLEPGQTLNSIQVGIESGLVPGESSVKYIAYNRYNPSESVEFDLNFTVEEKPAKQSIYSSPQISIHDVYPNPANEYAFVDYKVFSDRIKARMVIHNILGNIVGEYELPLQESKIKIRTEEFSAGIYFYTLYIDNKGVMTRKIVVDN
jgi:hypothetical protein